MGVRCPHCDNFFCTFDIIDTNMNHLIQEHGYVLLYIGQETNYEDNVVAHNTVAILGNEINLPELDASINFNLIIDEQKKAHN